MAEGKLREDLYYRLNVFTIPLPPLRDRLDDVGLLARHFAESYATRADSAVPEFEPATLERLCAYHWPGNVRELKNAVERAVLVSGGRMIQPAHLPPQLAGQPRAPVPAVAVAPTDSDAAFVRLPVGSTMTDAEQQMIRSTLVHTSGNKTRAAKILGISLKTMHNKVKKYGL
jgi:DNA-binding NtrC family response regulator